MNCEKTLTWLAHGCSGKWKKSKWMLTLISMVGPRILWKRKMTAELMLAALAHGCSVKWMRSQWTLTWLAHGCSGKSMRAEWTLTWPTDALGKG